MELYRIINFSIQLVYLAGHLIFLGALYRRRGPTPLWRWFFGLCIALWFWVSGRFLESVVYLFFPGNNPFYQFAANYQYLGDTTAAVCYCMWILYLAGHDRLAETGWLRAMLFACPVVICFLVFTNPWHHLFYTKLDMGERVGHGPLFTPCIIWSYLIILAGYAVSIRMILKAGRDRAKQIILFSLFPLLPAIGVLIRSISGVDRLDYTPVVMALSVFSMYQLVFKYHYANIISASIEEVIEQTFHPIGIYDPVGERLSYANRIADQEYNEVMERFALERPEAAGRFERSYSGRQMLFETASLAEDHGILITATDTSQIAQEQAMLDERIRKLEKLGEELEEARRNIDAYLDSAFSSEGLERKMALVDETWALVKQVLRKVEENLEAAKASKPGAEERLRDNLTLTQECIAVIRRTVAQLREGDHEQI